MLTQCTSHALFLSQQQPKINDLGSQKKYPNCELLMQLILKPLSEILVVWDWRWEQWPSVDVLFFVVCRSVGVGRSRGQSPSNPYFGRNRSKICSIKVHSISPPPVLLASPPPSRFSDLPKALVCTLADSGFFKTFDIKVAWSLQFWGYLRTLSLKFQKATSKMEIFLSLPCWLSHFSWDSRGAGKLQFWSYPSEI